MQFSAVLLTLGTLVSTVDVILAVAVYCVCVSTWLLCLTQPLVTFSRLPDEKQLLVTILFETMPLFTVLVLISSDCCI